MFNKIDFSTRNLPSKTGLFPLLEYAGKNGDFDLLNHALVFENQSTNKIKLTTVVVNLIKSKPL